MKRIHLTGTIASRADTAAGPARVLRDTSQLHCIEQDDVLIVEVPIPDLVPILYKVCAVVSEKGGKTAHLAKVCREMGVPCLVSVSGCMDINTGQLVIVDTDKGCLDAI